MNALRLAVLASLLLLAACGAPSTAAPAGASSTVRATLTDTAIVLDRTSAPAGKVLFDVKNTGTMIHELVAIRTDVAFDKLPVDLDEPAKVSEVGSKGESGDIEAGKTASFTLTLDPGSYVLICNQPGHYALGMRIAFTVK